MSAPTFTGLVRRLLSEKKMSLIDAQNKATQMIRDGEDMPTRTTETPAEARARRDEAGVRLFNDKIAEVRAQRPRMRRVDIEDEASRLLARDRAAASPLALAIMVERGTPRVQAEEEAARCRAACAEMGALLDERAASEGARARFLSVVEQRLDDLPPGQSLRVVQS